MIRGIVVVALVLVDGSRLAEVIENDMKRHQQRDRDHDDESESAMKYAGTISTHGRTSTV
ncbi:MAG: hypothetical protein HY292_01035 [Planctomycetes bacterium]|nr:hypothetical protein [Planctomycetota bacterium]